MIKGIRHIIFDLGGVLLNLDYQLTEKAFIELGVENFSLIYSQLKQSTLFDDLEVGKITGEQFLLSLKQEASIDIADQHVVKAWNAMLLDLPRRRLQILEQLRRHYDLFLLSNTNEIHEEAFNKIIYKAHGVPHIGQFFDRTYLSHRIGMRKPNSEVFEKILSENGLQARHTLFIDDSPQHIEGAKSLGIHTIWLQKGMTIEESVFKG